MVPWSPVFGLSSSSCVVESAGRRVGAGGEPGITGVEAMIDRHEEVDAGGDAPARRTDRSNDASSPILLVVDDEPEIAEEILSYLDYHGFHGVTAADGNEALRQIDRYPDIRIVVTDVRMPGLDGIGFINRLAGDFANRRRFEIIVVSGFRDEAVVEGVSANMSVTLIVKPVELKSLLAQVREAKIRLDA